MNNKGVTLIELLIVIVVLGIISAFAIPAVGDIITNTEKEAVLQDARAIESAARLYCGQKTCTSTELAGLTWSDLSSGVEVFDADLYEETDGDGTADTLVASYSGGEWTVILTANAAGTTTGGEYSFGASAGTGAVPSSSTKDQVFIP
ncbi:Fimbrial protein precursor [Candidatus Izimaplasma bacterium HR1]|jgi:type IV pilus assembly protein PilA|uniref:type II secretion system protein n=1 Tax=Candidatus Izimoplasma sp. HR1 TaxID=1541959 RepID=UPI0004F6A68C|nr:Fimbrial protein precursor [Candidatus Izimaplasma bacterium HR1]